jgi:hypothetical protein
MKPRIYIDTSIIGGCFDEEFKEDSNRLVEMALKGEIILLLSDVLMEEITKAPERIKTFIASLPAGSIEMIKPQMDDIELRNAYLSAGVVGPASGNDAHHVAVATIAKADIIVSWNFKHIVHWDKIRLFNAVNLQKGFALVDIRSPKEVIR